MIVALLNDPLLRATVRRAALPDEDVFWSREDVAEALERGFPRLAVHAPEDRRPVGRRVKRLPPELPVLALTRPTLRAWESARRNQGFAVSRVDDHAKRLRQLMRATAGPLPWVEGLFRDLVRAGGRPLPPALRGMGRRVLEFPARYRDLGDVARVAGLSRGALKARFRRRDLPSPFTYLRWFRVLAVAHVLADPEVSTEEAAHRTGLRSSGNLCRYVEGVAGVSPSDLRDGGGRPRLVAGFARECLHGVPLEEGWGSLEELFLVDAA